MICTNCGADNSNTIGAADGYIYCATCGEILNDCCFCGTRKGAIKAKEIEDFIEDEALMFCDLCAEFVKAINKTAERMMTK
ncbi:MAG TPA: hypothetical protein VEF53_17820 [Patescibacteria group bacterium]|nr:hypothetical protein [Patescibacteria group bacterium]